MKERHTSLLMFGLIASIALFFMLNLVLGSVEIPVRAVLRVLLGEEENTIWRNIILKSRLPQSLTAIMAGAGLAVSGLMMQTVFRTRSPDLRSWGSAPGPASE